MMTKYLITLAVCVFSASASAQNSDTLSIGKSNREFFIKGNQKYKFSEYKTVFTNAEALAYMKKANTNSTVSQIFGAVGGGFMGFGLGRALSGNKKEVYVNGAYMVVNEKPKGTWGLIGIGLGCVGIGIPFAVSSGKNLKKAVKTQNEADSAETVKTTSYKLDLSGNGLGLSYNF